jgi:hypothetical protein
MMTDFLASIPYAAVSTSSWNWSIGWLYYFVLFILVLFLYQRFVQIKKPA